MMGPILKMDGWNTFSFPIGSNGLFSGAFAVSFRGGGTPLQKIQIKPKEEDLKHDYPGYKVRMLKKVPCVVFVFVFGQMSFQ